MWPDPCNGPLTLSFFFLPFEHPHHAPILRWKPEHMLCQLPLGLEHRLVPGCSDTLGCDFGLGVLGGMRKPAQF